jgi:short-subunit dehydrogenase
MMTSVATRRTALVTGASAGIGAAFADVFAAHGFDVVLTARREDRLQEIAARLRDRDGIEAHCLRIDHAEPSSAERLCDELQARGLVIDALVNNAGYGVPGLLNAVPWKVHQDSLQVMVSGPVELAYRLLPGMVERGYGRIINVASLAGLVPAPAGHPLYGASKAFLIKFSEALGNEGRSHGVFVTALCPGFTLSEFHDVTGTRAQMRSLPKWMWLDAPRVAREGYDAVMAGTPVYINGGVNRAVALGVRYAPQWLVHLVGQRMAKSYRKT